MESLFFDNALHFRKWLDKNHAVKKELLVGFYKVGSEKQNMTWSEAVDQALCYGWIDGVVRPIDNEKYCRRFTPRKTGSIWSNVNIKKVAELTGKGLMKPAGITAFEKREVGKSGIYSFENEAVELSNDYENLFRKNNAAWDFFSAQPKGYKKLNIYRVMSAKLEKTQLSRLAKLIEASEKLQRIG
jgi:uncharacterized protein YdeI (YjbR/CyaY-like superfamily)